MVNRETLVERVRPNSDLNLNHNNNLLTVTKCVQRITFIERATKKTPLES